MNSNNQDIFRYIQTKYDKMLMNYIKHMQNYFSKIVHKNNNDIFFTPFVRKISASNFMS